jgi:hypothetical protein
LSVTFSIFPLSLVYTSPFFREQLSLSVVFPGFQHPPI